MKTPSAFPVLDNRSIDQWKVTELREELKRRKLTTKGLKDDLVRRLDEALRSELEPFEEVDVNKVFQATPEHVVHADDLKAVADTPQPVAHTDDIGALSGTPQPVAQTEDVVVVDGNPQHVATANADGEGETIVYLKTENMMTHGNIVDSTGTMGCKFGTSEENVLVTSVATNNLVNEIFSGKGKDQDGEGSGVDLMKNGETSVHVTSVETNITVNESMALEVAIDVQESLKDDVRVSDDLKIGFEGQAIDVQESLKDDVRVSDDLKIVFESQVSRPPQNLELYSSDPSNQVSEVSTDVAFQVTELEAGVAKPPHDGDKLNSSNPSNQVSEVNTVLGFQVKSDSISSDSVPTNEKNELKDNIIADNIKLEKDVKPEMVHPSSSNVISDGSKPYPINVEEPCGKKEPVDEGDENNSNLEMSKKNDSLDAGSSERLNLDRSSGDDSMDDDTMENKPIDSKYNSGVVDQGEKIEGSIIVEAPVVMSDDIPADKKDSVDEMKKVPAAPIVKRKLNDQVVVGNNENSKRQRRWNMGTPKVPEPQSNIASYTNQDTLPTTLKRSFSRSDSTASEGAHKERIVPPSPKSPTTSLRIDQFLRPFTLKAVQELLGKTGCVTSFWMDHIKTHCYVTYSSVEEAIETRNAVYNLQWPPNNGRFLLAEFVDPQEVKMRLEPPAPSPATPVGTRPAVLPPPPTTGQPLRQQVQRQPPLPPPPSLALPPPPPLSNPPPARECLPPLPMEKVETIDTPIVTLDDLFKKTKATPRIYYLPLTDEQVAAKRRNIKQ